MTTLPKENTKSQEEEKEAKIQELREIIANAQETISSATQLLSAIQGTTPAEMPINQTDNSKEEDGQTIYGYFDGQIMIGDDEKQYPVPANYASKSKLVEGDKLKLNITPDNRFVYKQIGPVQRNYLIGFVKQDAKGNFTIQTPEKEYQVLLATATYFKIETGDEVTLIVPQEKATIWGAIENVLQKNTTTPIAEEIINSPKNTTINKGHKSNENTPEVNFPKKIASIDNQNDTKDLDKNTDFNSNQSEIKDLTAIKKLELEMEKERITQLKANPILSDEKSEEEFSSNESDDEWASDIEKLKQEAGITINQEN